MPGANDLKDWMAILGGLVAVVGTIVMWRLRGEFPSRLEVKALGERVGTVERDMGEIKVLLSVRLDNMPDHEDMGDIRAHLARLEERVNSAVDTMIRIERPLNLLVEHHMKGSG